MGFQLSIPAKQLAKELDDVAKKTKKAGVRALNKTATQSRNYAQKETRKLINVKASKVKEAYKIAKARINHKKPLSEISVKYKQIPVIYYNGVRQTKKGITVKMRKDKGRMLFKGAFIAPLRSGVNKGAYKRKGKARLPVKVLRGPNVQAIFVEKLGDFEKYGADNLERIYSHELDFIFGRV